MNEIVVRVRSIRVEGNVADLDPAGRAEIARTIARVLAIRAGQEAPVTEAIGQAIAAHLAPGRPAGTGADSRRTV